MSTGMFTPDAGRTFEGPSRIADTDIWIGNASHIRSVPGFQYLFAQDIQHVIDLADKEGLPGSFPRTDITYCRFPLLDSSGNHPALLKSALEYTSYQINEGSKLLVCCSLGMSRSPAIVAGAMHLLDSSRSIEDYLVQIKRSRMQMDIDLGLLQSIKECLSSVKVRGEIDLKAESFSRKAT